MRLRKISKNCPSVTVKYGKIKRFAVKDVLAGTGSRRVFFESADSFIHLKETNWQKECLYGYGCGYTW